MKTISFKVSNKEKDIIYRYVKEKGLTISEFFLSVALEKIEDYEDYLLAEARMKDFDNVTTSDLRKLAEENGINYDEL